MTTAATLAELIDRNASLVTEVRLLRALLAALDRAVAGATEPAP